MDPRQFQEWADSPVTQQAFKGLRDQQRALALRWAQGECLSPAAQTKAKVLGELANLSFEDWFHDSDPVAVTE